MVEPDDGMRGSNVSPEGLVRRENIVILLVRLVVFVLLVSSTVLTSWFVYTFTYQSEEDEFKDKFSGAAASLVANFLSQLSTRLQMSLTLSHAVTAVMEAQGSDRTNLSFSSSRFSLLTQEIRFRGYADTVAFAPLVNSNELRLEVEAFVGNATKEDEIFACHLCDSPRRRPKHPEQYVEVPGIATYECLSVWKAGQEGVIPEDKCELLKAIVKPVCGCEDDLSEETTPDDEPSVERLEIPDQVYSAEFNEIGTSPQLVVLPYLEGNSHLPITAVSTLRGDRLPLLFDLMSDRISRDAVERLMQSNLNVVSMFHESNGPYHRIFGADNRQDNLGFYILSPVADPEAQEIIGVLWAEYRFKSAFQDTFSDLTLHSTALVENSCGESHWLVPVRMESGVLSLDTADQIPQLSSHAQEVSISSTYAEFEDIMNLASVLPTFDESTSTYCRYRVTVYPTMEAENLFFTGKPTVYAGVAAGIFLFTSCIFLLYDFAVRRRQKIIVAAANRTNDIVNSLFPSNIRDKLLDEKNDDMNPAEFQKSLVEFLATGNADGIMTSGALAETFPRATVMIFDVSGFTAWSSERSPAQVFRLLEAVYGTFDLYARRMGVFKVETVGDSYVCVRGIPESREDDAVVIAKFAQLCLNKFKSLTSKLEKYLGPSTSELEARIGLHSGPLTAGVLRGEKVRFQLFGDTVNTASRMESQGAPKRIHASTETAKLLVNAGYQDWVSRRDDKIRVKGKGVMETYWVTPSLRGSSVSSKSSSSHSSLYDDDIEMGAVGPEQEESRKKHRRLIEWNVEVLYTLLAKVVDSRELNQRTTGKDRNDVPLEQFNLRDRPIGELTQVLSLPGKPVDLGKESVSNELPKAVKFQLHLFVTEISRMYRDVPFHNFEHASHVLMSAAKLMQRIASPSITERDLSDENLDRITGIHNMTYGISSDALLQFAVVFSALVHDADHSGLTNQELIDSNSLVAVVFGNKSMAEQRSINLSWELLMQDRFREFRHCIFATQQEGQRFRQFIVNAVIATDIADKDLKLKRESRWDAAFTADQEHKDPPRVESDRRATVIFEYIIQASDIAHCMQHWHTYQRFNARLFEERYLAWIDGHAEKEPSGGWYGGELWFFDNYIIPLAKKLKKCGVFGVSHHEFLTYAESNRWEWEQKGKGIVQSMLQQCQQKYGSIPRSSA